MTQYNKRISVYMTSRQKEMLDWVCKETGENQSQLINALIGKEYYTLDKHKEIMMRFLNPSSSDSSTQDKESST